MSKASRWHGKRRSPRALPGMSLGQTRDVVRALGRFLRALGDY